MIKKHLKMPLAAQPALKKCHYTLSTVAFAVIIMLCFYHPVRAASFIKEPVQACVINDADSFDQSSRAHYAQCLGWQDDRRLVLCHGYYQPLDITPVSGGALMLKADKASLQPEGQSSLQGNVIVQDKQRIVNAQTAYIYRDPTSNQVTRVALFGDVRYMEPGRLMLARKAIINPQDNSAQINDVIYRLDTEHANATLPAWGVARFIERFANQDYLLEQATYSTCPPHDKAWQLSAGKITLDHAKEKGVARHAVLRLHDWPVFYTPYISFPTSKARKSGFLTPVPGYTNVGGFDVGFPYYWNIAPNYDATIIPHYYSRRGLMLGGNVRYLTSSSQGVIGGHVLPQDKAFRTFINDSQEQFPQLKGTSDNRWSVLFHDHTQLTSNVHVGVNYQQVSDDYYLQDFSTNLAVSTQNQLLRQGDISYLSDHWVLNGLVQSYQTLHPVNQSVVSDIYQRLPQLSAQGVYNDLPYNASFSLLAQYDNYSWPARNIARPEGPRFHLNPVLSVNHTRPWGYVTPSLQLVENNYRVKYNNSNKNQLFNRAIPRYSLDGGLFFERTVSFLGQGYTQTLEPRLYYLYVPYQDQTPIPVYDSAYMIFNNDQLFRTNRFSGFDRIGDANQLAFAVTTRFYSENSGDEKASFSIGQLRYFSNRRVQLCFNTDNDCHDNARSLGFLSPVSKTSPVATRLKYHFSPTWIMTGDYVWDSYTKSTNNGYLNFHYQPESNRILSFGYSYLVNGDVTQVARGNVQNNALNQATFAYSWPFTDKWSSLGVYSYNISKRYRMMSFLGVQYEDCCWAFRLMGGRTFKSISSTNLSPQYNNNVFLQVLLKGLGSAATSDPSSIINSYLPGYVDLFKRH